MNIVNIIITFMLICCTWIFFRANNFGDATYIFINLFNGIDISVVYFKETLSRIGFNWFYLILSFVSIVLLFVVDVLEYKEKICDRLRRKKTLIRWSVYIVLTIFVIVCKIYTAESQQFIYFNF